jgi:hypothetical protein
VQKPPGGEETQTALKQEPEQQSLLFVHPVPVGKHIQTPPLHPLPLQQSLAAVQDPQYDVAHSQVPVVAQAFVQH